MKRIDLRFFLVWLHLSVVFRHPKDESFSALTSDVAMSIASNLRVLPFGLDDTVRLDAHLNAGAEDAICTVQLLQSGTNAYVAWLPRRARLLDRLRMGQPTLAWLEGSDGEWHESPVHAREVSWEKLSGVEQRLLRQARLHWPQEWADEAVIEVVVPTDGEPMSPDNRFHGLGMGGVPRT